MGSHIKNQQIAAFNNTKWKLIYAIGVGVLISACQTPSSSYVTKPTEAEMSQVKQAWLDKSCVSGEESYLYRACVEVMARNLPPLDPNKREQFGEGYDPKKWLACRLRSTPGDAACDHFSQRRIEKPEFWPNPSILPLRWPDVPVPSVYSWSMSNRAYFDALCKSEAGDFIYRTVDNVEGIYEIRPKPYASGDNNRDLYVPEAPFVKALGLGIDHDFQEHKFVRPDAYNYFETPISMHRVKFPLKEAPLYAKLPHDPNLYQITDDTVKVARYVGWDGKNDSTMKVEYGAVPKSRYGYTWREIRRESDFSHKITGGEFAIVDMQTGEILALKRGFTLNYESKYEGQLPQRDYCPVLSHQGTMEAFIKKVLKPKQNLVN